MLKFVKFEESSAPIRCDGPRRPTGGTPLLQWRRRTSSTWDLDAGL
jgi:hypothetical protein